MFNKFARLFIVSVMLIVAVTASVSAQEEHRLPTSWAALVNAYQNEDGFSVWRYNVEMERGDFQFFVDYDMLDAAKTDAANTGENVLIDSSGDITFWALSTGECLIVSPTVDGAVYEYTFEC